MVKSSKEIIHKQNLKKLESHLKNYKIYKSAIRNLQKQLEFLVPELIVKYKNSCFNKNFRLSLEQETTLDNISKEKAIKLCEYLFYYRVIVNSIDEAIEELNEIDYNFVVCRYIENYSIIQTSLELGYSEKYIFNIRKQVLNKLLISLNGLLFLE
ncbi:sigma-70 family RNA polymerase sigma factor [Virgibacillus sp. AGTR]|uniref:sigma-70 family RNA polymerase sigma factor n=1 Tax=Virgibacillus sp. AGTR TaxID=2812055 RepID=UPI001D1612F2|nr:sigma-70 family RNA polymerase sigma factor [Virgibacillus sp. AGTR]MCC2248894.1 sigma-70 family RNA polymerase sigma factor [Virgibacillus sp. AGTR]